MLEYVWNQDKTHALIFDPDGKIVLKINVTTEDTYFIETLCKLLNDALRIDPPCTGTLLAERYDVGKYIKAIIRIMDEQDREDE